MKYILIATAILALAACKDERPNSESESGRSDVASDSGRNYKVECIDGVEYWLRSTAKQGYMAPRIDPKTMTFVSCEGN
jgi:hypothetical protein